MNRIAIGPEGRFSFGGENFVITVPVKEPRLSTSEAFTIAKNEAYLRVYEDLASAFLPRSILELGIFQGGSYVLLDKLFNPRRMSAVDISRDPVEALSHYVADNSICWLTMRPILTNKRKRPLKFSSRCSSPAVSI